MKIVKKILIVLIMTILCSILFVGGVILVNSYKNPNNVPSFFGWKPFIVLSETMENEIMDGDIVVVKQIDTNLLEDNDIVAYKNNNEMVIISRIIEIEKEDEKTKYKIKVDNSSNKDMEYILPEQIEGIYKFRIAKLGNFAIFIQTPIGMIVFLSIPLILLLLVQCEESTRERKYIKNSKLEIEKLKKEKDELNKINK